MSKLDYQRKFRKLKKRDIESLNLLGKEANKYPRHTLIKGGIFIWINLINNRRKDIFCL